MKSKAYGNIVETAFRAYETEICLQSQASEKFWDCIADHGRAKEKLWNRKHSRHTNLRSAAAAT